MQALMQVLGCFVAKRGVLVAVFREGKYFLNMKLKSANSNTFFTYH